MFRPSPAASEKEESEEEPIFQPSFTTVMVQFHIVFLREVSPTEAFLMELEEEEEIEKRLDVIRVRVNLSFIKCSCVFIG